MEEVGWSGERYSNDLETVTTSGHQDNSDSQKSGTSVQCQHIRSKYILRLAMYKGRLAELQGQLERSILLVALRIRYI